jgi:flagellar M-ring protein FliF
MENNNVIEGTVIPTNQINLAGVLRIPAIRQLILLLGVAGAIAAGFAIVLWSRTPEFTPLFADLNGPAAAEVADALRGTDIEFKLDSNTGQILVAEARLHEARMQLATKGLPQGAAAGPAVSAGVSGCPDRCRTRRSQITASRA